MANVRAGALVGASLLAALGVSPTVAQQQGQQQPGYDQRLRAGATFDKSMNERTIGVLTEGVGGTSVAITSDLAHQFDNKRGKVRLLGLVGKGSIQNIADLIYLKGADISIVQVDALEYYRRNIWQGVDKSIHYISKMYDWEVHILAGQEIGSLNDLAGKKVNMDLPNSGTHLTGSAIFERLGIPVEVTTADQARALEMLDRGEIAAAVVVSGKPLRSLDRLASGEKAGRFRLLGVPPVPQVLETYKPVRLTHDDYPGLIPPDEAVDTVAVGSVLAAFNWPANTDRYGRVARFVESFFSGFDGLRAEYRHPKWREVDIRAEVPGWTRFRAAQEWLRRNPSVLTPLAAEEDPILAEAFEAFLRERAPMLHRELGAGERARLFQDFQAWRSGGETRAEAGSQ